MQNTQNQKNPRDTFIGGIVIGGLLGSLATYIIMANWIINHFN